MSAFSAAGQFHIYPGAADLLVPVCRLCRLSDRIAAGTGLYQRAGGCFCRHPVSVRNRRPAPSGRLGGPAPSHPPQMDPQRLLRPGTGRQRRLLFHPARLLGTAAIFVALALWSSTPIPFWTLWRSSSSTPEWRSITVWDGALGPSPMLSPAWCWAGSPLLSVSSRCCGPTPRCWCC